MTAGYRYQLAGGGRAMMRASDTDRERVTQLLNTAYVDGRLFRDEYDTRLEMALTARTYADLDALTADLPGALPPAPVMPVPTTNGLAIASLVCALAQLVAGPLTTIPAIVLGHMARRQIRRTGEQGAGMALAGLVIGWTSAILGLVIVAVVALTVTSAFHGPPYPH